MFTPRFANGVHKGEFQDDQVLLDLVTALVHNTDREKRGKGLQNFSYGPALWDFAHTCLITSGRLYRKLARTFQLPNERTLK